MRKSKVFVILGLLAFLAAGCARGEQPHWGVSKGVVITLTMRGNIDSGVRYLVALDTEVTSSPAQTEILLIGAASMFSGGLTVTFTFRTKPGRNSSSPVEHCRDRP